MDLVVASRTFMKVLHPGATAFPQTSPLHEVTEHDHMDVA